ncbi:MAG: PIG-L family deacetylase [Halobacteriovoraceae bacterium]|nr:PIG-L family deacetylase [Halobacteriovoraceae bacterium]MCB9095535.1 PIG-L family deacetylase [Halobacteriovoraceae bacterium]
MKVLAIGAHPDDIEIGCGGTLLKLVETGADVEIVIATNGESGDNKISKQELASLRQAEAGEAATIMGVRQVHFLDLEDGLSGYERSDKIKLINLIRKIKPQIVFVHSREDIFPDHKVVHEMTMSALKAAAGPWYQECIGDPHDVENIYGYEVWNPINNPQCFEDISKFYEKKIVALSKHQSQVTSINYCEAVKGLASYRGVMSFGKYAEAFEVIKTSMSKKGLCLT